MPEDNLVVRPAGEGESRTSRTHVSEESDSGIPTVTIAELNEEYIARMEDVLAIYEKPLTAREPVVCVDEKHRQFPTVIADYPSAGC